MDDFQTQQQKDNCEDCFFCDESAIGKGTCCTYPSKLKIGSNGECLTRKEQELAELEITEKDYQAKYAYACGYLD